MNNKDFYTIGHIEIPQRQIFKKPLWYFDTNNPDGIRKIMKEFKKLTGYGFDNSHLKWSNIFGHLFAISIYYGNEEWMISLWDNTGHTALGTFHQNSEFSKEEDFLDEEIYKIMCKVTEDFVRGKINCSGCGKQIKISEIAGSYFAGRYCEHCWETKYKAIEARETYN